MQRITNTTAATESCLAECRRVLAYVEKEARFIALAAPENDGADWMQQRRYDLQNAAEDARAAAERARAIAARRNASRAAKENARMCSQVAGDAIAKAA